MRSFEHFSYQCIFSFAKRNKEVIAFFQNMLQTKSNKKWCFLSPRFYVLAMIAGSEKCISSTL